jgi:hypothetical protein
MSHWSEHNDISYIGKKGRIRQYRNWLIRRFGGRDESPKFCGQRNQLSSTAVYKSWRQGRVRILVETAAKPRIVAAGESGEAIGNNEGIMIS